MTSRNTCPLSVSSRTPSRPRNRELSTPFCSVSAAHRVGLLAWSRDLGDRGDVPENELCYTDYGSKSWTCDFFHGSVGWLPHLPALWVPSSPPHGQKHGKTDDHLSHTCAVPISHVAAESDMGIGRCWSVGYRVLGDIVGWFPFLALRKNEFQNVPASFSRILGECPSNIVPAMGISPLPAADKMEPCHQDKTEISRCPHSGKFGPSLQPTTTFSRDRIHDLALEVVLRIDSVQSSL